MHQIQYRLLGELTALPKPSSGIRGYFYEEGEKEGVEARRDPSTFSVDQCMVCRLVLLQTANILSNSVPVYLYIFLPIHVSK